MFQYNALLMFQYYFCSMFQYNFVTPLTSMVVTKPEKKERNDTDATLPEGRS